MSDRLQNYKIDPNSGHLVVNPDKIDITRMIFEDDLNDCIMFVEPDFSRDNCCSKSVIDKGF